jgi:hypothetical protein
MQKPESVRRRGIPRCPRYGVTGVATWSGTHAVQLVGRSSGTAECFATIRTMLGEDERQPEGNLQHSRKVDSDRRTWISPIAHG